MKVKQMDLELFKSVATCPEIMSKLEAAAAPTETMVRSYDVDLDDKQVLALAYCLPEKSHQHKALVGYYKFRTGQAPVV